MKRLITCILITITAALALGTTACSTEEPTSAAALTTVWQITTAADLADHVDNCKGHDDCQYVDAATGAWAALDKDCSTWTSGVCQTIGPDTDSPYWVECHEGTSGVCCILNDGSSGTHEFPIFELCCDPNNHECSGGWFCGHGPAAPCQ